MKQLTVYYQGYFNSNYTSRSNVEMWEKWYDFLSEEDAIFVGTVLGNIKPDRISKLINHTSRKFTAMRTKKDMIVKVFSETPVEYQSATEQQMERIKKYLNT